MRTRTRTSRRTHRQSKVKGQRSKVKRQTSHMQRLDPRLQDILQKPKCHTHSPTNCDSLDDGTLWGGQMNKQTQSLGYGDRHSRTHYIGPCRSYPLGVARNCAAKHPPSELFDSVGRNMGGGGSHMVLEPKPSICATFDTDWERDRTRQCPWGHTQLRRRGRGVVRWAIRRKESDAWGLRLCAPWYLFS